MSGFKAELRSLAAGSLPHTNPALACELILETLDIPTWPQLTQRSFLENMYVQYSEGFPGLVVDNEGKRIFVDRCQDLIKPLEAFYSAYLEDDIDKYPMSPEYAAGLHTLVSMDNLTPRAVKGQITGPITWGMTVTDEEKRGIIYDETLGDVVAKLLRLKAGWQEKELRRISKNTIIFARSGAESG